MQMKIRILILVLHLLPFVAFCQKTIVPGSREINTSYLKPEKSLYTVYYVKDTSWAKQGTMAYDISFSDNKINLFYKYTEKNNEWSTLRTSIADAKSLKSISYKSEGTKSKLELNFGETIKGNYYSKKDKKISS
jgi:hypothetical protein